MECIDELPKKKKKHHKKRSLDLSAGYEKDAATNPELIKGANLKKLKSAAAAASPVLFPCDLGIQLYSDPCKEKRKKSKRKLVNDVQEDIVCPETVNEADGIKRKKKKHKKKRHNCVDPNNDEMTRSDRTFDVNIADHDRNVAVNDVCGGGDSSNRNTPQDEGIPFTKKIKKHKKDKKKIKEHDNVEINIEAADINGNVDINVKRKHNKHRKKDNDIDIKAEIMKHKNKKRKEKLISCVNACSAEGEISSCISLKNRKITDEQQISDCVAKKKKKDRDRVRNNDEKHPELKMAAKAEEGVKNQWATAEFDDAGRQQKFLRLLGGFKESTSAQTSERNSKTGGIVSNTAMGFSKEKEFSKKLENQFNKAMTWNVGGQKGSGLGFQAPPGEGKKFHIDTTVRKSKKFD